MKTLLRLLLCLVPVLMFAMVFLYLATFWAIWKTEQRIDCYHTAKSVEDCAKPGWLEQFVRDVTDRL